MIASYSHRDVAILQKTSPLLSQLFTVIFVATSLCEYDAIMAYTTYEEGKGYDDVVKNCTNTGNVHAN